MIEKKRGVMSWVADLMNPYRWITTVRNVMFDLNIIKSHEFPLPTICIGNISAGGTGKTPHTEFLIELLKEKHRLAVLSRGYGRKSKGYIKADDSTAMPQIGDEPFQIKNKFPEITVAVCEKRVIGIERLVAEDKSIEAILLDDAYQHRHVKAGLNILLIDSNRPIWQDRVLPFGRLRESIAGIRRADVVIMTKCKSLSAEETRWCRSYIKGWKDIPVFFSRMRYGKCYPIFTGAAPFEQIRPQQEVLVVTGIANPAPLREEIEKCGAKVTMMKFGDHHNFTQGDIAAIAEVFSSIEGNEKIIITTEKDATRLLQRNDIPPSIKERTYALPIKVEILEGEEKMFNQIIESYVTENSRNS